MQLNEKSGSIAADVLPRGSIPLMEDELPPVLQPLFPVKKFKRADSRLTPLASPAGSTIRI